MFAIPRGKVTYIGTTDTNYNADKNHVTTELADAIYLISAVNNMFPDIELELDDIISSWAGLRPLIHEEGKSASELSRKDEIFTSDTGLVSIAGGKLTGYRKMAERVVNRIVKKMEEDYETELKACTTDKIPLCGNDFKKYKHVTKYIDQVLDNLKEDGFEFYHAWYLVTTYGKQTEAILERYANIKGKKPKERMIKAEAQFAMAHEMALNPLDFFIRRTGRLYFDIDSVRKYKEPVFEEFQKAYNYSAQDMEAFSKELDAQLTEHSDFSLERG